MDSKAIMDVITFVCTLATGMASIVIPIILYRTQKQKATLDYVKSGRDSWIQIDLSLMGNPHLLRQADSILAPDTGDLSDEQRQKTWMALMILNVAFSDFLGLKYGYHEQDEKGMLDTFIRTLMRDELTYRLSQQAYNEAFRAACRKARQAVLDTPRSTSPGDIS